MLNNKLKLDNQAFTLIEIIIYTALASVLVVSVVIFAMNIIYGQNKVIAGQEVQENLRFASSKLRYSIKSAEAINSISSSTLVLDNGADPDVTFNFDDINKKLTKQVGSGPIVDLTSDELDVTGNFSSRSFGNHAKNVKIDMTASYKNPENVEEYNASQSVSFTVELRDK